MKLNEDERNECLSYIKSLASDPRIIKLKKIKQHHCSNRYTHCVRVAYSCYKFAIKSSIKYNMHDLLLGAILHDYFSYDWRDKDKANHKAPLHNHPKEALAEAKKDFEISPLVEDIIVHHMWPITLFHIPRSKEAFLVSWIDKVVSFSEASRSNKRNIKKRFRSHRTREKQEKKLNKKQKKK
jgi:uncharacterized protein